jgi:hypothetical protein
MAGLVAHMNNIKLYFPLENQERRDQSGNLDIDGRIVLK